MVKIRDYETEETEKRSPLIVTAAIVIGVALLVAVWKFGPAVQAAAARSSEVSYRTDFAHWAVLDNSKSMGSMDSAAKSETAAHVLATGNRLETTYGPVYSGMVRFGATVVDLYGAPYDKKRIAGVLKDDYLNTNADPERGTYLAPALRAVMDRSSASTVVLVTVGGSSWEDGDAVRKVLAEAKKEGRKLLVWVHGVTIHNVVSAQRQMDLRGRARNDLAALGQDAYVSSSNDDNYALNTWLPRRLRHHGVKDLSR